MAAVESLAVGACRHPNIAPDPRFVGYNAMQPAIVALALTAMVGGGGGWW